MQRPEATLSHSDIEQSISSCRRVLAYLLRSTRMRMQRDSLGDHRWKRIETELAGSLPAFVVSEKTPLSFYRAVCGRFHVDPSGGDSEFGPVEAWLPEGRIRWDRALAAMHYADMRTVVHESPHFFATFACSRPSGEDDVEFQAFPSPPPAGGYVPTLPKQLIARRTYRTVWTLLSPLSHGADEKSSNVNLFRREPTIDPLTGERHYVPFLSGNAVRGLWRDLVMARWLELIGLTPRELPPSRVHALFSGGAVEQGADGAPVNLSVRRAAREACPPWDLLAGTVDQQIMGGRGRVHDAVLVCRENAWLAHSVMGRTDDVRGFAASLPESSELTCLRLATRQAHKDYDESDGQQMMFNTEFIVRGAQLVHSFQLYSIDGVAEVTAACLADLLAQFQDLGTVAGQAARGMGMIAFDPYEAADGAPPLPDPSVYTEHVAENRDRMRDWALKLNDPVPSPKKRGKREAKAPVESCSETGDVAAE